MSQFNLLGSTLGRFEILNELGRGGMAVVYRARQLDLDRIVALKVLPPEMTIDASYVARFRQEARSAARLEHPHIVPIYEIGEANGLHYIAMKYIQGRTLKQLLQDEGALRVPHAAEILAQVGEALDYAHQQGMIHRDIKPTNIMLSDTGWVYLTDFGLARDTSATSGLTIAGTVMGTPEYMSPEQAQGLAAIGSSTDIYALGVVLYEMLTGNFPFKADTPMGMVVARLAHPPQPPRDFRADLPMEVEDIVMKALARRPESRYKSAGEMVASLRRTGGATTTSAKPPLTPQSGTPRPQQTPAAGQPAASRPATPPYVIPANVSTAPAGGSGASGGVQQRPASLPPATVPASYQPAAAPKRMSTAMLFGLLGGGLLILLLIAAFAVIFRPVTFGGTTSDPTVGPEPTTDIEVIDDDLAALLTQGEEQLGAGDLDQAIATYQQVLESEPANVAALAQLAMIYTLQTDYNQAREISDKLVTENDSGMEAAIAHAMLAESFIAEADYPSAQQEALASIDRDKELSLGHAIYAKALAAHALDRRDNSALGQSEDEVQQALATMADEPKLLQAFTLNAIGLAFASEHSFNDDGDSLRRSLNRVSEAANLQSKIALFQASVGSLYVEQGEYGLARDRFKQALKLDAKLMQAQAGIGWSYFYNEQYDQAIEAFDAALKLDPEHYEPYFGKGRVLLAQLNYDPAIEQFSAAMERRPKDALPQAWIGQAYLRKGFDSGETETEQEAYTKAEEAFQKALQINDHHTFAMTQLGWILQYQERYEESVKRFQESLKLDENQDGAHNGIGWSLYNLDRYTEAEPHFRRAVEIDNTYANAFYGLGQTLEKLDRADEAKDAYERALRANPDYKQAKEALERLN